MGSDSPQPPAWYKRGWCLAVALIALFAGMSLFYGRVIIQSDGITYYALTRSLVCDKDFDLENEMGWIKDLRLRYTRSGREVSVYSCGYAILYAPMMALLNGHNALDSWMPYAQNIFFPFGQSLAVFLNSVILGLLAVYFGYRTARANGDQREKALFISIAIFLGTTLVFYTFSAPSFPHAADAFLVAASFVLILTPFRGRSVLLGFTLGMMVLLRNVNVVMLPAMVLTHLYLERKRRVTPILMVILQLFLGALPTMVLQFYYNITLYGNPFLTGYGSAPPPEFSEFASRVYRVMFRPSLGIFIWSPITFLGLIGLILGSIHRKPASLLSLACVLIFLLTLSLFGLIYPGASFGNRYFTLLFVFWVVGLSELLQTRWKRIVGILATVAMIWTLILFNAYYIVFASTTARREFLEDLRTVTPAKELRLAREVYADDQTGSGPIGLWFHSLGSRPYPSLLFILFSREPES
jgi:hypothetical protein